MSDQQTFSFQAEVQQLLHLMIHALYSHKEIFLRELISNGSDACDRLRFESLTDKSLLEGEAEGEPRIRITIDKDARSLRISDNGIGMTRDEVTENIGTIARSGTRRFVEALSGDAAKDANLIGQFGVGFYSAFMVAERVVLETRKAGRPAAEGVRWESDGAGEYSLADVERDEHGTAITLHLREGEDEFLEMARIRTIIAKYSDNIALPVQVPAEKEEQDDGEPDWETLNSGSALWARPRNEISDEEYNNFFANLAFDPNPPLLRLHNRVEGNFDYTALLFVPSKAPFDLFDREQRHGIKLYVRRVFIMDDTRHLMPAYLRFVRGVVDSADLPLNVSREFLQHNREIDLIRSGSVKKLLGEFARLAKDEPDQYATFWDEFGRVIKEGVVEDHDNRQAIAELLRFASTHDDAQTQRVSLKDYVGRMGDDQKSIFYLTADSHAAAQASPHLEYFRKQGIEVLLLSDPVDEWLVGHLNEYQDKPLKSVARGDLDREELGEKSDDPEREQRSKDLEPLLAAIQAALGERVQEVRLSDRLVDSPACLVADEKALGANLQRILESMGQAAPESRPILELNPEHPLIRRLDSGREDLADWAEVLFDQAALSEGAALKEPAAYVRRINRLLASTLGDEAA
ncbi:MAG: molecular chaperone HtpG [Gammaproteobacteria bacterium]|nr:molecular chaperone HtpG [Gammaproteobacteria bacterium]